MKSASFIAVSAIAFLSAACSPTVDVTRVVSQEQATRYAGTKMMPSAIVHANGSRTELSSDTTIANGRAVVPKSHGLFVVHLGPNDVIQVDADDRITGVRSGDGHVVSFVPGTAVTPEGSDEVRGRLAGGDSAIDLAANDQIEVHGTLAPGDQVEHIGHVESSRNTYALVFGTIVSVGSYVPTAGVALESSRAGDRVLLVPILGPWIDLLGRNKCTTPPQVATDTAVPTDPCVIETSNRVGIVISGVAQAIGGALLLLGLPARAELIEDEPGHSKSTKRERPSFSLSIAPLTVSHGSGISAVGSF